MKRLRGQELSGFSRLALILWLPAAIGIGAGWLAGWLAMTISGNRA